jgi:hypothetical protein
VGILALWLCSPALAHSFDVDLRYTAASTQTNFIDETFAFQTRFSPWLEGNFAARLAESAWEVESFSYQGDLAWTPLKFFSLHARLAHSNLLPDSIELTHLLGYARLDTTLWDRLELYAAAGWYERFALLSKVLVLPTFRNSYREHDWAGALGFRWQFIDDWWFGGQASTFEEIDVFNLNNPFLQAGLEFRPLPGVITTLYGRYQILLGFGRLDSFLIGLGLHFTLPQAGLD